VLGGLLNAGKWVIRAAEYISATCLVLGCTINFVNILGRYFFHAPIVWAEEIIQFMMIAGVFFGAPILTLRRAHIRMDMMLTIFPESLRRGADVFGQVVLAGVCCAIIWLGVPVIMQFIDFGQVTDAAAIPVAIPQSVIPIGLFLVIVAVIVNLLEPAPTALNQSEP
jgi:TRAP-type C4-dicarboxylate transport system permease small subunit